MPTPFPVEPSDVDPAWLLDVLAGYGVDGVENLTSEPVGTGQMARSQRYSFITPAGPASVVCKFPSANPDVRTLGATAYRREVAFYRDAAVHIEARIPACHHLAISDDATAFVLVLEDLAPARQGDQLAGCSPEQAAAALDNLARLHASTWSGSPVEALGWLHPESHAGTMSDYMALAHPAFAERFGGRLGAECQEVLAAFAAGAATWDASHPATGAAVHGDYRLDNLLFGDDGSVAVVDWQTVSFSNPGRDLAYFLGNSLQVEDRRRHEHDLVRRYLDTLHRCGVTDYDEARCWDDLRHGAFQGPLVTMLGALAAERTDRGEDMFVAMAERSAAQILDHRCLDLLR